MTPTILLAIESQELLARINAALERPAFQVLELTDTNEGSFPDLVLTDSNNALSEVSRAIGDERFERGDTGVVAFAEVTGASVRLDEPFSDRELNTTCRLLGEVVRLTRAQRRGSRERSALAQMATTDAVSGLPNRHAWDAAVDRHDGSGWVALAILDVDKFKEANDQMGYRVGDQVLQTVGKALAKNVRENDLAARIGGDEFALLLPTVEASFAYNVIERIRAATVTALAEADLDVTISAGFATSEDCTINELFEQANAQLRTAKKAGGNCSHGS